MPDFIDTKRKEIDGRLQELRPLVDEFERLEKAAQALAGVNGTSSGRKAKPTRARVRGAGPTNAGGSTSRARKGRPRGSGARGKQALELVQAKPGITIAQLADEMGIKANYLYRVMPGLQAEGLVAKRDNGWHPA